MLFDGENNRSYIATMPALDSGDGLFSANDLSVTRDLDSKLQFIHFIRHTDASCAGARIIDLDHMINHLFGHLHPHPHLHPLPHPHPHASPIEVTVPMEVLSRLHHFPRDFSNILSISAPYVVAESVHEDIWLWDLYKRNSPLLLHNRHHRHHPLHLIWFKSDGIHAMFQMPSQVGHLCRDVWSLRLGHHHHHHHLHLHHHQFDVSRWISCTDLWPTNHNALKDWNNTLRAVVSSDKKRGSSTSGFVIPFIAMTITIMTITIAIAIAITTVSITITNMTISITITIAITSVRLLCLGHGPSIVIACFLPVLDVFNWALASPNLCHTLGKFWIHEVLPRLHHHLQSLIVAESITEHWLHTENILHFVFCLLRLQHKDLLQHFNEATQHLI